MGRGLNPDHMGEIVNLRRARKAKARQADETKAETNRLAHGRTKAERKLSKAEADAARKKLDGHKRDDS